jgi:hypothetical protein
MPKAAVDVIACDAPHSSAAFHPVRFESGRGSRAISLMMKKDILHSVEKIIRVRQKKE